MQTAQEKAGEATEKVLPLLFFGSRGIFLIRGCVVISFDSRICNSNANSHIYGYSYSNRKMVVATFIVKKIHGSFFRCWKNERRSQRKKQNWRLSHKQNKKWLTSLWKKENRRKRRRRRAKLLLAMRNNFCWKLITVLLLLLLLFMLKHWNKIFSSYRSNYSLIKGRVDHGQPNAWQLRIFGSHQEWAFWRVSITRPFVPEVLADFPDLRFLSHARM